MPRPGTAPLTSVLHRSLSKNYPIAVRGDGVFLEDFSGKRYLDFSGSAAVNFIGHGIVEVWAAVREQTSRLEFAHSSQFTSEVAEALAADLIDFAGPAFSDGAVFFTCGGSEAVETALKLARQYQVERGHPERFRIASREQSYHGATLGAMAASGNKRRQEIYAPLLRHDDLFTHIGMPNCYRCAYDCNDCARKYADELQKAIDFSEHSMAAFIAEPISGATLGAVSPPAGYFKRIAEICRREDIVFISDEVMTGMGRCGSNFAFHHWESKVAPDILVLAKGLTSGYLPLGAVIASKKTVDALRLGSRQLVHGFTYNGHPACVAAGKAVLDIIKTRALIPRVGKLEETMRHELNKLLEIDHVGDVRGVGLLWGIEFVAGKTSKSALAPDLEFAQRVAADCSARGVLVYPMQGTVDGYSGDHLLIAPPAIISEDQIVACAKAILGSIKSVSSAMKS